MTDREITDIFVDYMKNNGFRVGIEEIQIDNIPLLHDEIVIRFVLFESLYSETSIMAYKRFRELIGDNHSTFRVIGGDTHLFPIDIEIVFSLKDIYRMRDLDAMISAPLWPDFVPNNKYSNTTNLTIYFTPAGNGISISNDIADIFVRPEDRTTTVKFKNGKTTTVKCKDGETWDIEAAVNAALIKSICPSHSQYQRLIFDKLKVQYKNKPSTVEEKQKKD